jgi:hypothetical protein
MKLISLELFTENALDDNWLIINDCLEDSSMITLSNGLDLMNRALCRVYID